MPRSPTSLTAPRTAAARVERERERKRMLDDRRGTAASRGYDSRWQKARAGYLRKHPLCVQCEAEGVVMAARVVDHIVPHRGDSVLFWDSANWQPLCDEHHNRKTATEDGGFVGRGGSNL